MPIQVDALLKKKEHFDRGEHDQRTEDLTHELFELEEQGEWNVRKGKEKEGKGEKKEEKEKEGRKERKGREK